MEQKTKRLVVLLIIFLSAVTVLVWVIIKKDPVDKKSLDAIQQQEKTQLITEDILKSVTAPPETGNGIGTKQPVVDEKSMESITAPTDTASKEGKAYVTATVSQEILDSISAPAKK